MSGQKGTSPGTQDVSSRSLGYYASEAGIAALAAFSSVFIAGAADSGAFSARVIQFGFVFTVALAAVVAYRWVLRSAMRRELWAFVAAEEAQMKRAKDQFIGNVSHGLRTPLTGIVGFAHVLKDQLTDAHAREAADMIIGSAADLGRVVDDLLVAARLDAGILETKLEDVGFKAQIETVLEFTSLMDSDTDVDCQDAPIRVDPEQFRHVLRNLLVNAHRHGRPPVMVRGQNHGGRYICDVADHGSGVPTSLQEQIFTRFAHGQSGEIKGNVGLGLSVVRELSAQMGIQVSYRRHMGMSHFVLSIPLAETPEAVLAGRSGFLAKNLSRVRGRVSGHPA